MLRLCSSENTTIQAISVNTMSLTHGFVLYMVAIHTEALFIADNYISNYSSTPLTLSVVYCQFAHKVRESLDYLHLTFDPWTSVQMRLYSCMQCNKRDYSWVCRVKNR